LEPSTLTQGTGYTELIHKVWPGFYRFILLLLLIRYWFFSGNQAGAERQLFVSAYHIVVSTVYAGWRCIQNKFSAV